MIAKFVNIDNIRDNIIKLKSFSKAKFCAVVKANAYGHGIEICRGINDLVDFYAVATAKEALTVKKMRLKKKILLLSKFDYKDLNALIKNQIRLTVDTLDDVAHIVSTAIANKKKAYVHIKINTGMNRLGIKSKSEFLEIYNTLKTCEYVKIEGIYTHYATAESKNSYKLKRQNAKFLSMINLIPPKELKKIIVHCSNSAGFLKSSKYAYDMVRVGIAMYGYDQTEKLELKPALTIKAKVVKVQDVKKGESVGYGAEFVAPCDMKIAVVAMGYADGFLRQYKDGYVIIKGQKCKIVGRICMDMFMCDVTHLYLNSLNQFKGNKNSNDNAFNNCEAKNEINENLTSNENCNDKKLNDEQNTNKIYNQSNSFLDEFLQKTFDEFNEQSNKDSFTFENIVSENKDCEENEKTQSKHSFMNDFSNFFEKNVDETLFVNNDIIYKLLKSSNSDDGNIFDFVPLSDILQNILQTIKGSLKDLTENLENEQRNNQKASKVVNFDLVDEWATILGQDGSVCITAKDLANLTGTIEYEVLTNFNNLRL